MLHLSYISCGPMLCDGRWSFSCLRSMRLALLSLSARHSGRPEVRIAGLIRRAL